MTAQPNAVRRALLYLQDTREHVNVNNDLLAADVQALGHGRRWTRDMANRIVQREMLSKLHQRLQVSRRRGQVIPTSHSSCFVR